MSKEQKKRLARMEKEYKRERKDDLIKIIICILALLTIIGAFAIIMINDVVPGMYEIYNN